MRTPRVVSASLLGVLALIVALVVPVSGASMVEAALFARSTPMPGDILATAPQRLDIFTAEDLSASNLNAIDVRAADAREVDQRDITLDPHDPRHLSVGLQPGLGAGRYVVTFVAAHDSQTVDRGQFSFYIGLTPTSANRAADARLSVDTGVPQVAPAGKDPTAPLAVGIAVGLAGAISAGTIIALRRRGRHEGADW